MIDDRARARRAGLAWVLLAVVVSGGCASGPVDYARGYPEDKEHARSLDVQVFREGDRIRLTNTSPLEFGASTVWINGAFSRPIGGLRVGQSMELSLHDFRDAHSKAFRAGGFFATKLPSDLVLAEIEWGERLFGLTVVEDRAE